MEIITATITLSNGQTIILSGSPEGIAQTCKEFVGGGTRRGRPRLEDGPPGLRQPGITTRVKGGGKGRRRGRPAATTPLLPGQKVITTDGLAGTVEEITEDGHYTIKTESGPRQYDHTDLSILGRRRAKAETGTERT